MQRPRSIILLIVWFLWATGQDLSHLARFSTTTDYYVFASIGMPWLYFVLAMTVFLLNAASVFYLYRPEAFAPRVLWTALGAAAAQNLLVGSLTLENLDGVRQAYAMGRELRGLPVREGALDMLFQPAGLGIALLLSLCAYALVAWLVRRNRAYFSGAEGFTAAL